jgi:hypothetical protein
MEVLARSRETRMRSDIDWRSARVLRQIASHPPVGRQRCSVNYNLAAGHARPLRAKAAATDNLILRVNTRHPWRARRTSASWEITLGGSRSLASTSNANGMSIP